MSKLQIVVGGQYGSEGKGAVAGYLSHTARPFVGVRVAGPNAGHTVYGRGPNGEESYAWRLRTVPVNAVTNPDSDIVIAAGSEIDVPVLEQELTDLDKAGYEASARLLIDGQATVLEERHHDLETIDKMHERLGSTGKGIGAARADRILRKAQIWSNTGHIAADTGKILNDALCDGATVCIEGTQGYALGLHAGRYPYCTSSDTRAIDFAAMAGVMPWADHVEEFEVYVVLRTYPIRVAGNSGPMNDETSWEELGFEPELTTVTKKVRRVAHWDPELAAEAVAGNGGSPVVRIALTMFDYEFPEIAGHTDPTELSFEMLDYIRAVEAQAGASVQLIGTGPTTMIRRF